MRVACSAVVACVLTLALAACGSSGSRPQAVPAWVTQANAVCHRYDPRLLTREPAAGVFTAAFVNQWNAELTALGRIGLPQHIPNLVATSNRALRLIYAGNGKAANRALLAMQHEASTQGVHCSFGARPLGPAS